MWDSHPLKIKAEKSKRYRLTRIRRKSLLGEITAQAKSQHWKLARQGQRIGSCPLRKKQQTGRRAVLASTVSGWLTLPLEHPSSQPLTLLSINYLCPRVKFLLLSLVFQAGTSPFKLHFLDTVLNWNYSWYLCHAQLMHSSFSINAFYWMLGRLNFLGMINVESMALNTRWAKYAKGLSYGVSEKIAGLCLTNQSSDHQGGSAPSQVQRQSLG